MATGTIQTTTGLYSGIDYETIVTKLMAIAARPRDALVARNKTYQSESTALTEMAALLTSVEYTTDSLGKSALFGQRSASSSNSTALSVTVTGTPSLGSQQFTPLKLAQTQQMLSSGYSSRTSTLGSGTVSFRFGEDLAKSLSLDVLNAGEGFERGKIRITDRSGTSAEIDLSTATSLDDVLGAISDNATINVTAVAHGDSIELIDDTGQTTANLRVQEVGGGSTAASLGLADVDKDQSTAVGDDIVSLYGDIDLSELNGGLGVRIDESLPDIKATLRNGISYEIDLSPLEESTVDEDRTLQDVIDRINAVAPGKLQAEISADGERLVLTDLSDQVGENTFTLESLYDSHALADLGLEADAVGGVIQSRRLLGGLQTALLSQLGGGQGLGELGDLKLVSGTGPTVTIDLSSAETVDDVLDAINASGAGITAQLNSARTGIELVHAAGGSAHMLVANGDDGLETADKLQLAVDDEVTSQDSGDLHMAVIAWGTELANLNGGAGVAAGRFTITDSNGQRATLRLSSSSITTIGELIQEINRLGIDVEADINQTGDGIVLRDTAGGTGTLQVAEGSSTTAADLHLLGGAATVEGTQTIDGTAAYTITVEEGDTLEDLYAAINDLGAGVTASIISDGSSKPYRLSLTSSKSGTPGRFVLDASSLGMEFDQSAEAQDGLLAMGDASQLATSLLVSSSNNKFTGMMSGATLLVRQATATAVTVTVSASDTNLVSTLETFVKNYNSFRDRLDELTAYNTVDNTSAALTGDSSALRMLSDLPSLLTGRFTVDGSDITSLAQIGVTMGDDGTLTFDQTKLEAAFDENAQSVEDFFSDEDNGVSAKFHNLIEQLAGESDSMLSTRLDALDDKITKNEEQANRMQAMLDLQSEALYLKFYRMETAIAEMESILNSLDAIKPLSLYSSSSSG